MQEGKRQKQVGGLIQEEVNNIFQRIGLNIVDGGMVSISSVKITPDLLEARIYLSIFNAPDAKAALKKIEERAWEVKKELASRVKHQLRRGDDLVQEPDALGFLCINDPAGVEQLLGLGQPDQQWQ